jgi:hypothetical protein
LQLVYLDRYLSLVPGKSQVGGINLPELVYVAFVLAVAFMPVLLRRRGPSSDDSDSDSDDGGWGKGPPPPTPPDAPRGGIPLDDAEPSRTRLRGHERLADGARKRARRPSREPERRPVRTSGRP